MTLGDGEALATKALRTAFTMGCASLCLAVSARIYAGPLDCGLLAVECASGAVVAFGVAGVTRR